MPSTIHATLTPDPVVRLENYFQLDHLNGGMRIEDMVVVEKHGCRVLNEAPKVLEI